MGGQTWKSDTRYEASGEKQFKLNHKKYLFTILTTDVW